MKKFLVVLLSIFSCVAILANNVKAESANIISNGDFEGMLVDGQDAPLTEIRNGFGSLEWDSYATVTKDPLNADNTVMKFSYTVDGKAFSSFFKFCTLKPNTTYKIDFDYMVVGSTDNFGMRFAPDVPKLETTFYKGGATDGWEHATWEWTTDKDSSYDSIGVWFNTGSSLDNVGYIDNIVITMVEEVEPEPEPEIENPFDPNKTYYQSESMTVNGDFEKFAVGTIFSEEQLEGAWGSVNLDNPATIQEVNGSHVMDITAGAKVYSSAFLMMPDTLEVGDLLRLTYDVKLVLSDEAASYTAIDSCLVGGSNVSYYTINYKALDFAGTTNMTSGEELLNYPITITAKENGWYNVSFDFQLTNRDLIQTNSLRFLFTAKSAEDHMYIDNVNLYSLSETPFDTSVKVQSIAFNDGASVNMTVGDEKTLGYTINPSDATDKSVTFTSSNESVATVDANGKVVAVGKGACTVTVTAANGVKAEIAILVAEKAAEPAKGCWGSVGASILGVITLAGAAFVVAKRKKD